MQEAANENKAQKLAAARKKLKEYQNRSAEVKATHVEIQNAGGEPATSVSNSSNVSERSNSEHNLVSAGSGTATPNMLQHDVHVAENHVDVAMPAITNHNANDLSSYFGNSTEQQQQQFQSLANEQHAQNLNAIQVLISEKMQLSNELDKVRADYRQKDAELEAVRAQCNELNQNMQQLQIRASTQLQSTEQLRNVNAELQHKLAQAHAQIEDQETHLNELKKQLSLETKRLHDLEQQNKQNSIDLEMAQLRIRQLSDESGGGKDVRVESMTQTQLMYEQQIRDLQAMVQELSHDKEQASTQYQQYVQHLNLEMSSLKEKNSELIDQCTKLQEREEQLVTHISTLEREIQKNLSRQDQLRQEKEQTEQASETTNAMESQLNALKEQIIDFDLERHEFQLKIKSQEDRLETLKNELQQKQQELAELQEQVQQISADQPDQTKLLATLESNKIAASRALTQNIKLKEQLDELEMRFVQLTNDKAELVNKLDAETYANREMRQNYDEMTERLRTIDERFKYKDDEMIRLSHENVELQQQNELLQQEVKRLQHDELDNYEVHLKAAHEDSPLISQNQHSCEHAHNHNEHEHEHNHEHSTHNATGENFDACQEAAEEGLVKHQHSDDTHEHSNHEHHHHHQHEHTGSCEHATKTINLQTTEALEKLQARFAQLISKVAALTDEKQRLEHLVEQLGSETETIGEYIALYQTQRRILKQREYEKAAQMKLLQEEREQMQEKISMLNQLVGNLGMELPAIMAEKQQDNAALLQSVSIEPTVNGNADAAENTNNKETTSHDTMSETNLNQKLNSLESQQILTKIQSIITEIKENTKGELPLVTTTHAVDHLNCCSGKFEVV